MSYNRIRPHKISYYYINSSDLNRNNNHKMTDAVQTAAEDDNDVYLITASAWKGISMVVFTSLSIIGFIVAILLKERAKQLYISSGSMFSAGTLRYVMLRNVLAS
jgi:hypothetical protein